MKPTFKILIVANNCTWNSWPQKIRTLHDFFSPKIDLLVDLKNTSYPAVPFVRFRAVDPKQNLLPELWGIEEKWYDQNVTSLAAGYDIVLFTLSLKQWRTPDNARGWRTDRDQKVVELQVGADENESLYQDQKLIWNWFEHYGEHEIMHALYMISGQEDKTHYYDYEIGKLQAALDDIQLPVPHAVDQQTLTISLLERVVELYKQLRAMGLPESQMTLLDRFCAAIKTREGYFAPGENSRYPTGTISWKNKNPGNLRYNPKAPLRLAIGGDRTGYAIFKTYEDGWTTLRRMVSNAASGLSKVYHPDMTILQFFQVYAPGTDNNDPQSYAEEVAFKIAKDTSFKISGLLDA